MKFFLVKDQKAGFQKIVNPGCDSGLHWYSTVSLDGDVIPSNEKSVIDRNLCKTLKDAVLKWRPVTVASFNQPSTSTATTVPAGDAVGFRNAAVGGILAANHRDASFFYINYQNARMRGYDLPEPSRLMTYRYSSNMSLKLFVTMIRNKSTEVSKMDLKVEGDLLDLIHEVLGEKATVNLYLRDLRPVSPDSNPEGAVPSGSGSMATAGAVLDLDALYEYRNNSKFGADGTLRSVVAEGLEIGPNSSLSCFNSLCKRTGVNFPFALLEEWNLVEHYTAIFTLEVDLPTATDTVVKDRMKINRKILEDGLSTDFEIVAGVDGSVFRCHKAFLCAHSPVFDAMFRSNMEECQTGRITIADVSSNCVKALMAYLYCWEIEAPAKDLPLALELLKVAHKYDIRDLENVMRHLLTSRDDTVFELDFALELFLFARNLPLEHDLKMKAVQVFKLHVSNLDSCEKYNQLFRENPTAAKELCKFALSA